MGRLIVHNKRDKRVWNMSLAELKAGEWLKDVPDSDMVEIGFKNNYLTISDAKIRRGEAEKAQGGDEHGEREDEFEDE